MPYLSLKELTEEQIKEMAMVEVAYELFKENRKPYIFNELVEEVAALLGLTKEQVEDRIAQFYTDMNIDGRFICVGENMWGLRTWYPYEQIEEEIVPTTTKPKKKKAKKALVDDLDEDFDDIEDDLDFDDLDDFDDTDDEDEDDEDFDDLEDVDLDDDDDLIDDDDEFDLDEEDDEDFDDEEEN